MKPLMKSLKGLSTRQWLIVAGILVAVVALAGGVALHMSRTAAENEAAKTHSVTSTSFQSMEDASKLHKIGGAAQIGPDLSVTITKLNFYKGSSSQVLVAAVKTKNTGREKSDPRSDLVVGFARTGMPTAGESTCEVDLGKLDNSAKISLAVGTTKTYAVCMNLQTTKITDGQVSIRSNSTGDHASWSTKGAVTKKLAEAAPEIHNVLPAGGGVPATASPKTLKDLKKNIKKAKKARKTLDKQIDLYKKLPDAKKKKIKKFEKERKKLDKAIDQMEDIQKQLGG